MKIEITEAGKDGLLCAGIHFVLYLVFALLLTAFSKEPNMGFWLAAIALTAYDSGKGRGQDVPGFTVTKN